MNGDLGGDLLVGVIGDVLPERIGQLDLAGFDELQDRDGCEHFVHGADAKTRIERVGNLLFAVRQSIGAAEEHLAVLRDQHGPGKAAGGDVTVNSRLDGGYGLTLRESWNSKR